MSKCVQQKESRVIYLFEFLFKLKKDSRESLKLRKAYVEEKLKNFFFSFILYFSKFISWWLLIPFGAWIEIQVGRNSNSIKLKMPMLSLSWRSCPNPKDILLPFASISLRKLYVLATNIKCSVPSAYARYCEQCDSFALFVGTRSKPSRCRRKKEEKENGKDEEE